MIKLTHVTKSYQLDGDTFSALKDVNIHIKAGEFSAILGPSGSGKSTLMHIIGLLDLPTSGNIMIEGNDVSDYNDNQLSTLRSEFVGFVFQQFNLINKLTVMENILLPTVYAHRPVHETREYAQELIARFGLGGKEHSYPNKISGGQQQRVAIARALIMHPKLVLADEPTGNLDSKTGSEIMKLLTQLNKNDKITIIIVTHEHDIANYTKRKIYIRDGQIHTTST